MIEYYVPDRFRKGAGWIPPDQRGKVIQFSARKEVGVADGDAQLSNLIQRGLLSPLMEADRQ